MNIKQIDSLLKNERHAKFAKYVGYVWSEDSTEKYPRKLPKFCTFIYWTPGHVTGVLIENQIAYYFCSGGVPPDDKLASYLLNIVGVKHIKYNGIRFQSKFEFLCSFYIIYYVKSLAIGIDFDSFCSLLEGVENADIFIRETFKVLYNIDIPTWQTYYLRLLKEGKFNTKRDGHIKRSLIRRGLWTDPKAHKS